MAGLPGLRYYRKKEGLSQKQLAEKAGVSDAFISQLENERHSAGQGNLQSLALILNCTTDDLLTAPSYDEAEVSGTVAE